MLVEEASAEGGEPLLDDLVVVLAIKGMFGKIENLLRRETVADEVVDEEVVKLVRAYEVFGLLLDVALFVGRRPKTS